MAAELTVSMAGAGAQLAVRLAALLARPFEAFEAAGTALAPLTATEARRAAALPAFSRPLGRAVSRALGVPVDALDATLLGRLRERPESRLATLVLVEPRPAVEAAGATLAAAIVHGRAIRATLRAERERLRAVLGAEGFELATREAPLLHAPLGALDAPRLTGEALFGPLPAPAATERLALFGVAVLARFAGAVEPAYGGLLALRWPAACAAPAPLPDAMQAAHIVKLMRRMPRWSALIG